VGLVEWQNWENTLDSYFNGDFILSINQIADDVRRYRTVDEITKYLSNKANLDPNRYAFLASSVLMLCEELSISTPEWARKNLWLKDPFFPCDIESIRIYLVAESPIHFRKNNIFVSSDIFKRV